MGEKITKANEKLAKGASEFLKKMDGIEYRDRTEEELEIKRKLKQQ